MSLLLPLAIFDSRSGALTLCLHSPDPPSPPLHPNLAEDSRVSEKASWPGWALLEGCLFLGTAKKPLLASVSSVVK